MTVSKASVRNVNVLQKIPKVRPLMKYSSISIGIERNCGRKLKLKMIIFSICQKTPQNLSFHRI